MFVIIMISNLFFLLKLNLVSQCYYWIAVQKRCVLTIKNIKDVTDEIATVSNFSRMISQFFFTHSLDIMFYTK